MTIVTLNSISDNSVISISISSVAEATDSLSCLCCGGFLLLVILMKRDCRVVQSPSVDWDPGRAPLFYRDLRDVGFFLKEFIYLRERETVSKKGNPSRRVGEEEAGSRWRSPMKDSFRNVVITP